MSKPKRKGEPVATSSPDLVAENVATLGRALPPAVREGRVDWDTLRAMLGEKADERGESYRLTWAGKRNAIGLLQAPSRATLVPAPAESQEWGTTSNVFIEGDNLEALKLLYRSYFGRVKMIYIDPPYNTGQDFIYPDDYADPLEPYLRLTGQKDDAGNLLTTNPETDGRYHSRWLSMMYPRLVVARQLLRDDGVIFVSIDDHEVHDLRLVMNEVFGEENYYTTIAWQRRDTPAADARGFSVTHEYLLAYVRSPAFERLLLPRTEKQKAIYRNPDNDPRGPWTRGALTAPRHSDRDTYPIPNPQGRECRPPSGTSWRVSRETYAKLAAGGRIWWGKDGDADMPFVKRFLSEVQAGVVPVSWWDYRFAGSNRNATMELRDLFPDGLPFESPKPTQLVKRLLMIATCPDAIILDFFAGSCTTAQAVLELNREDGGKRQVLLVQVPEPVPANSEARKAGLATIAEIGKERIRRVIRRMTDAASGQQALPRAAAPEDLGFRVFKLTPSPIRPWTPPAEEGHDALVHQLEMHLDPLEPGWRPETVIWEMAIKEAGFGLNSKVEQLADCKTNTVFRVSDPDRGQSFRICLDDRIKAATPRGLDLQRDDLFICRAVALDDNLALNLSLQCRLKTI